MTDRQKASRIAGVSITEYSDEGHIIKSYAAQKPTNSAPWELGTKVAFIGLGILIVYMAYSSFCNGSACHKAISIIKNKHLPYSSLQVLVKEEEDKWRNQNAEDDATFIRDTDPDTRRHLELDRAIRGLHGHSENQPWDEPQIVEGPIRWEAHVRSGDGRNTPQSYVWVQGSQKIQLFRGKQFSNDKILGEEATIKGGAYLIDLDRNTWATSSSPGDGYIDFYNAEAVTSDWLPIPE
jgi:hypothetical protein